MMDAITWENVGRNDPCPCGSGKKYKKCCMGIEREQREGSQSNRSIAEFIGPATLPVEIVRLLELLHRDNLMGLYHELFHELGPQRARYTEMRDLAQAINRGDTQLAGGPDFAYRAMRLDDPDIHLLLNKGLDDPGMTSVRCDIVTLRPNEIDADGQPREVEAPGWRVWSIQQVERAKTDLEDPDARFADLGLVWTPRVFVRPARDEEE